MAAVATPHHTRDSLRTRPKCIAQRHRSTPARRDPHTDALARQSSILQFRHRSLKRRRGYAASSIGGFADRPGRPSSCRTRGLRGGPPNRYYVDEVIRGALRGSAGVKLVSGDCSGVRCQDTRLPSHNHLRDSGWTLPVSALRSRSRSPNSRGSARSGGLHRVALVPPTHLSRSLPC